MKNLIQCNNGHYYDADEYPYCPHCAQANGDQEFTTTLDTDVNDVFSTTVLDTGNAGFTGTVVENSTFATTAGNVESDEQKTVGYYEDAIGTNPVVGWLVCIEGNHFGEDFKLVTGRNFIGRSASMDIKLSGDSSVSHEKHAVIVYEPKSNIYLIQSGDSKELSYLNDEVVLESKQIKVNDIITVGATKLMFIPCCSDKFTWEKLEEKKD